MSANPVVTAGVPELVAVLKSLQAFITNLGTVPEQVPIKFPGALQVLLGTVEMQFPALASAEFGALQTDVSTKIQGWITKLQAVAK
jgi:hypothetical protein